MSNISYKPFQSIEPGALLKVVNEQAVREHLVEHDWFTEHSLSDWMQEKIAIDELPQFRIRAILVNGNVAGWCGIQPDDCGAELAIVLSRQHWGLGTGVFKSMLGWARELGHQQIVFHLLDSRREYKALQKLASRVEVSELMGRKFNSYYFLV